MSFMRAKCKVTQSILDIAKENGINIKDVSEGWGESKMSFDMDAILTDDLRDLLLKKFPKLKYVEYDGSPHDKPYRGFKCMSCSGTVIFPLSLISYS